MAYSNPFPMSYQPYYSQYSQMPAQTPTQNNNSIIWVQGEAGAKSYLVAPNSTVQLWDSERQTIYLKSADASGMPSIKTLDYTIRQETQDNPLPNTKSTNGFITQDDLKPIQDQIDAIRRELGMDGKAVSNE